MASSVERRKHLPTVTWPRRGREVSNSFTTNATKVTNWRAIARGSATEHIGKAINRFAFRSAHLLNPMIYLRLKFLLQLNWPVYWTFFEHLLKRYLQLPLQRHLLQFSKQIYLNENTIHLTGIFKQDTPKSFYSWGHCSNCLHNCSGHCITYNKRLYTLYITQVWTFRAFQVHTKFALIQIFLQSLKK